MQRHFEHGILVGKLRGILMREGHVHIERVFGVVADNLIFEARNKGAGTEFQLVVFAFAAVKCNAVHKAFKVDHSDIAVLRGSVFHRDDARVAVHEFIDLGVDLVVSRFHFLFGGFEFLVCLDFHVGLDIHFDRQLHAVFTDLFDISALGADSVEFCFLDRVFHSGRIADIQRVFI